MTSYLYRCKFLAIFLFFVNNLDAKAVGKDVTFFSDDISSMFGKILPKLDSNPIHNSAGLHNWMGGSKRATIATSPPEESFKPPLSFTNFVLMPNMEKKRGNANINQRKNINSVPNNSHFSSWDHLNNLEWDKYSPNQNSNNIIKRIVKASPKRLLSKLKKDNNNNRSHINIFNKLVTSKTKTSNQGTSPVENRIREANLPKLNDKTIYKNRVKIEKKNALREKYTTKIQNKGSEVRWKNRNKTEALRRLLEIAGDEWDSEKDMNKRIDDDNIGSSTFKCPEPEGYFADRLSCTVYYHCDHGVATMEKCRSGLAWNKTTNQCDWQQNVNC